MSANPVQNPLQKSAVGSGRRVEPAAHAPRLLEDQDGGAHPEPDRDSARILQPLPADGPAARRSASTRACRRSSARSSRSRTFARRRRSTSSSTRSATGSASAASSKACAPARELQELRLARSRSTRSRPARCSATTAARSTPCARTLCDNCGEPVGLKHKHDQQECQERGMSYSVPLKVKIRLTVLRQGPGDRASSPSATSRKRRSSSAKSR